MLDMVSGISHLVGDLDETGMKALVDQKREGIRRHVREGTLRAITREARGNRD